MQLTYAQKQEFYQNGYVKIPGVVPQVMIDAAVRAINASVGQGIDPAQVPIYQARSFCPELQREPVIIDLFNKTPALPLAESLIGIGKIQPVGASQIALRFPILQDPPSPPRPPEVRRRMSALFITELCRFAAILDAALLDPLFVLGSNALLKCCTMCFAASRCCFAAAFNSPGLTPTMTILGPRSKTCSCGAGSIIGNG